MKVQLLKQWNVEQVEPVVAISPDGRSAIASSGIGKTVDLIEVPSGTVKKQLNGHKGDVSCLAISPDGLMALSGSVEGEVRLWNLVDGTVKTSLTGHSGRITSVEFCSDGKTMLTGSWDKTCRLWSLSSGECIHTLQGHSAEISGACAAPNKNWAMTVSFDGTARLWDLTRGQCAGQLKHNHKLTCISVNAEGRCLVGDTEGCVGLSEASPTEWDIKGPFQRPVSNVVLSADGTTGFVGLAGGQLYAFNFQEKRASQLFKFSGRLPEQLPFGLNFSMSQDERYVIAARACCAVLVELSKN